MINPKKYQQKRLSKEQYKEFVKSSGILVPELEPDTKALNADIYPLNN